ncbi:hypothetical protein AGLY_006388 [Aphis glycines]|uniref:Uncharacterized protein n=1 Tax=Aphis glycines TaxID=307491 RepID=A0A6G0TT81_APHGL|nr:hypothetical protein AGLY_006388 [Aphis glycines]
MNTFKHIKCFKYTGTFAQYDIFILILYNICNNLNSKKSNVTDLIFYNVSRKILFLWHITKYLFYFKIFGNIKLGYMKNIENYLYNISNVVLIQTEFYLNILIYIIFLPWVENAIDDVIILNSWYVQNLTTLNIIKFQLSSKAVCRHVCILPTHSKINNDTKIKKEMYCLFFIIIWKNSSLVFKKDYIFKINIIRCSESLKPVDDIEITEYQIPILILCRIPIKININNLSKKEGTENKRQYKQCINVLILMGWMTSLRIGIKCNPLYLVLVAVTVEKLLSNKYVERKEMTYEERSVKFKISSLFVNDVDPLKCNESKIHKKSPLGSWFEGYKILSGARNVPIGFTMMFIFILFCKHFSSPKLAQKYKCSIFSESLQNLFNTRPFGSKRTHVCILIPKIDKQQYFIRNLSMNIIIRCSHVI